jgi:hypothetical protein
MSLTLELEKRVELVSMDGHFHDITIALYRKDHEGRPQYRVHTYSQVEGASWRIEFIRRAIKNLLQLDQTDDWLYFRCGSAHQAAAKRGFLEACKLPSTAPVEPRPLTILDRKSGRNLSVSSLAEGRYHVAADGPEEGKAARIESVAGGLRKLGEFLPIDGAQDRVTFPCGQPHDALVGLLLPRALNVRAVLREEEEKGTRGMLVAPSQQKGSG